MSILNELEIRKKSQQLLDLMCGEPTNFREGQVEAIISTLSNKRTLVVQRTGWGKSFLYFACSKILRDNGNGVALIISPLLVLMDNQIEQARKIGLNAKIYNSTISFEEKEDILESVKLGSIDILFITPESLFSNAFQNAISTIKIGFFVIDEAHCMSDWGHDFRLKYGKLYRIINQLPDSVPVLCTTATANNRVVDDLKTQLGGNIEVSRGPLSRKSLVIQIIPLRTKAEKYAWILENLDKLSGSGIIYCLTTRDCEDLANFLVENGISAKSYFSKGKTEEDNRLVEKEFMENKIKVIVATIKLGMGYDKGDISFVIHYRKPKNLVSYYQQIGRAGRNINLAYAIMLVGGTDDDDVLNYFIDNAFPKEISFLKILDAIKENSSGLKLNEIIANVNERRNEIIKTISFLENDGYIHYDKGKYYISPKRFEYNHKHYDEITKMRKEEMKQLDEFISSSNCYSKYLVNILDDSSATGCGKCPNCIDEDIFDKSVSYSLIEKANIYLENIIMDIEPRKQWPKTKFTKMTKIHHQNQKGICLSKYADDGYGKLVQ